MTRGPQRRLASGAPGACRSLPTRRLELIRIAPKSALASNSGRERGPRGEEKKAWEPRGQRRAGRAGRRLVFPLGARLPELLGARAAGGFGDRLARAPCSSRAARVPGWNCQRAWAGPGGLRSCLPAPGFSLSPPAETQRLRVK